MFRIIATDGRQYGPVSVEQIRQWIAEGRASAQTLVQAEGSADWKPLGQFPELAANVSGPVPPPMGPSVPPRDQCPAVADKKIAAGVLALIPLTGSLGIHKFVLGYTGEGLTMLLISLLTCGIGAWVMWIIALVEGIIYLTKSDAEFVATYVANRRGWF